MRSDRPWEGYLPYHAIMYGKTLFLSTNPDMTGRIAIRPHTRQTVLSNNFTLVELHRHGFTRGMLYTQPVRYAVATPEGDVHFFVMMELPMWGAGATVMDAFAELRAAELRAC